MNRPMNSIVVIEDDRNILRGLTDSLRAESYEVHTAGDGAAGYHLVREKQPDLVILDLMLPGMNGYDVCREIRRHGFATPILMLTAQDREASRVEGFEAGADDYVTKPFSLLELLGRVRAILRRSEGRSDLANQKELDDTRRIQERLMPSEIPQIHGARIAGTWRPARIVGGDYFDVLKFDDARAALCIADVCGKGMPAALMMSSLQAAVKAYASIETRPADLCARVNRVMFENMGAQGFISFVYAVLDTRRREVTYVNAGHNPPLLAPAGVEKPNPYPLQRGGLVLGVFGDSSYEEEAISVSPGSRILMYTDGVTECRSSAGEEFGDQRLAKVVARTDRMDATALTDAVIRAAGDFSNGRFEDDLTVVAVTID